MAKCYAAGIYTLVNENYHNLLEIGLIYTNGGVLNNAQGQDTTYTSRQKIRGEKGGLHERPPSVFVDRRIVHMHKYRDYR
jgi:hypothetical protein